MARVATILHSDAMIGEDVRPRVGVNRGSPKGNRTQTSVAVTASSDARPVQGSESATHWTPQRAAFAHHSGLRETPPRGAETARRQQWPAAVLSAHAAARYVSASEGVLRPAMAYSVEFCEPLEPMSKLDVRWVPVQSSWVQIGLARALASTVLGAARSHAPQQRHPEDHRPPMQKTPRSRRHQKWFLHNNPFHGNGRANDLT